MRNLKRALSLALASVMLLGMMVVGSSAAFADADEIVNTEAVEITAGLKIFEGSDGKFNPKGTVTRAQMATVIVKMLYGSEINADQFKGTGKFSDTAAFEGGWAEGYINLCANLGIVKGYGDGTFKPGQAVNTAEAATMIINALGVDAGEGTWPMTVMAAVEEIELFEDMEGAKPATYAEMTRDQLAVAVWNGLNYSSEGVQGYKVVGSDIVFKTWSDAAELYKALNSTTTVDPHSIVEVKGDTLAETVFEIEKVTGYIASNQATGDDKTAIAVIDGSGNVTYTNINLETGLDQLGHFVTAYYKEAWTNELKPGEAYCVVEEADYVKVGDTFDGSKKLFTAAFGTTTVNNGAVIATFDNAGNLASGVVYTFEDITDSNNGDSTSAYSATSGTYMIDKENGALVGYMANIATSVQVVGRISTVAGKESIRVGNTPYENNADLDEIVEYDGIAEDDIVVVKNYQGTIIYVEKPEVITGKFTKTASKTVNYGTITGTTNYTYVDGKEYVNRTMTNANGAGLTTTYTPDANKTYDVYLYNGKIIGAKLASSTATLTDAIYVVGTYPVTTDGAYGATTVSTYAQGIDAEGKEVSILIHMTVNGTAVNDTTDDTTDTDGDQVVDPGYTENPTTLTPGFYSFEKSLDNDQAKKNIMYPTAAVNKSTFDNAATGTYEFYEAGTTLTAGQTLALDKDTKSLNIGGKAYTTADTKFVVIDSTTINDELEVATYTGTMNKTLSSGDAIKVAVTKDADGNYLLAMVVITTASTVLDATDFIYVVDANCSVRGTGKYEYSVYMTETDEFTTIIADKSNYGVGFYGSYTIDNETDVYTLTGAVNADPKVVAGEYATGVFGNSISTGTFSGVTAVAGNITDMELAEDVKIYDVRSEDILEDTLVGKIETLKDIQSALKGDYKVQINVLTEQDGADYVVTHIIVTEILAPTYDTTTGDHNGWNGNA